MQIYIQVKQLDKRKDSIEAQKFIIKDSLFTVHDLLYDIVTKQVDKFNHRAIGNIDDEPTLLNYLSLTQIENQSPSGKISFNCRITANKNKTFNRLLIMLLWLLMMDYFVYF